MAFSQAERGGAGEKRDQSVRLASLSLPLSLSLSLVAIMEVPEIDAAAVEKVEEARVAHPQVDPFLVEALQNSRHRLTGLASLPIFPSLFVFFDC